MSEDVDDVGHQKTLNDYGVMMNAHNPVEQQWIDFAKELDVQAKGKKKKAKEREIFVV